MTPSGFHAKPVKRFARNHSVKIQAAANRRTNGNLSPRPYRHASPAAIAGHMARYRESRTTPPEPHQVGMESSTVGQGRDHHPEKAHRGPCKASEKIGAQPFSQDPGRREQKDEW